MLLSTFQVLIVLTNRVSKHIKKELWIMEKVRYCYCGRYYDDMYEGHLDNGSNCCPQCEKEEKHKTENAEEEVMEK